MQIIRSLMFLVVYLDSQEGPQLNINAYRSSGYRDQYSWRKWHRTPAEFLPLLIIHLLQGLPSNIQEFPTVELVKLVCPNKLTFHNSAPK